MPGTPADLASRSLSIGSSPLSLTYTYEHQLISRSLQLSRVDLLGRVTLRSYRLDSSSLSVERVPLTGRFTTRVNIHESRDLVLERSVLSGVVAGAIVYPQIVPSQLEFKPPRYSVTAHPVMSGEVEAHLWADSNADATLALTYQNIADSKAEEVWSVWDRAKGTCRYIDIPVAILGEVQSDLAQYMVTGGKGARWYFAGPPLWEARLKGYGELRVSLVSRHISLTSAALGDISYVPAVPAEESTTGFTECDYQGADPDGPLVVPPTWVRQKANAYYGTPLIGLGSDSGYIYLIERREESSIAWIVITKFNAAGEIVLAKHINQNVGFGSSVDLGMSGFVACLGPQGLVVAAFYSPSSNAVGSRLHRILCLSTADLSVKWARSVAMNTRSGGSQSRALGVFANKDTGHTYVFMSNNGGGNNSGSPAVATYDINGVLTGVVDPNFNVAFSYADIRVYGVTALPNGSVLVGGSSTRTPSVGPTIHAGWTYVINAAGTSIVRGVLLHDGDPSINSSLRAMALTIDDGIVYHDQFQNRLIFCNMDCSVVNNAYSLANAGSGIHHADLQVGPDGRIYGLMSMAGAFTSVPWAPPYDSPSTWVSGGVYVLSSDGSSALALRNYNCANYWGDLYSAYPTPGFIRPGTGRMHGWLNAGDTGSTLVSFDMGTARVQYPATPSYSAPGYGMPNDTFAKFVSRTTGMPVALTTAPLPVVTDPSFSLSYTPSVVDTNYLSSVTVTDVVARTWNYFNS